MFAINNLLTAAVCNYNRRIHMFLYELSKKSGSRKRRHAYKLIPYTYMHSKKVSKCICDVFDFLFENLPLNTMYNVFSSCYSMYSPVLALF